MKRLLMAYVAFVLVGGSHPVVALQPEDPGGGAPVALVCLFGSPNAGKKFVDFIPIRQKGDPNGADAAVAECLERGGMPFGVAWLF